MNAHHVTKKVLQIVVAPPILKYMSKIIALVAIFMYYSVLKVQECEPYHMERSEVLQECEQYHMESSDIMSK